MNPIKITRQDTRVVKRSSTCFVSARAVKSDFQIDRRPKRAELWDRLLPGRGGTKRKEGLRPGDLVPRIARRGPQGTVFLPRSSQLCTLQASGLYGQRFSRRFLRQFRHCEANREEYTILRRSLRFIRPSSRKCLMFFCDFAVYAIRCFMRCDASKYQNLG